MRLRTRFSLRTLLIAVLLAGAGCWYFLNGSAFNVRELVEFRGTNKTGFTSCLAIVERHRFLPRRTRLAALLFPDAFYNPNRDEAYPPPIQETHGVTQVPYPNTFTWTRHGDVVEIHERHNREVPGLPSSETTIIELSVDGHVYEANPTFATKVLLDTPEHITYKVSPTCLWKSNFTIKWNQLVEFAFDSENHIWTINSLEQWLLQHRQ